MDEKKPIATIKIYAVEPPVLDQCPGCVNAVITNFEPLGCPEIKNIRTSVVICLRNHDVFAEGVCNSFKTGTPQNGISLPLLGHA